MEYAVICTVALLASAISLFSGFGLGTILLPVFAVFFPVNIAVFLAAIVHLLNNLFKLSLLFRHIDKGVALRFGLPAILAALLGAWVLTRLSDLKPLITYQVAGHGFEVMPVSFTVALLIVFFALWEILPKAKGISFDRKYLPVGGVLSGFFGGVSGQQGALRSAFMVRSNLSERGFVATGVVIACLVDIARIPLYTASFSLVSTERNAILLGAATLSAFLGAFAANRWLTRVTMRTIQMLVSIMLFGVAVALGSGLV